MRKVFVDLNKIVNVNLILHRRFKRGNSAMYFAFMLTKVILKKNVRQLYIISFSFFLVQAEVVISMGKLVCFPAPHHLFLRTIEPPPLNNFMRYRFMLRPQVFAMCFVFL